MPTKKNKTIAIIGHGYVGKAYERFFQEHFNIVIYDPHHGHDDKDAVNKADMAVICVPTNQNEDRSADLTALYSTMDWLDVPLVVSKSALPPGTADYVCREYNINLCVSPEYVGEGNYFVPFWKYPDPDDATSHGFLIVGGEEPGRTEIVDFFMTVMGPDTKVLKCSATDAELIKYMENCWGATKVTFCNELYEIAKAVGADYQNVREGFLMDSRTERMHTMILPDKRGFGGKCFPKDIASTVHTAGKCGYKADLLEQVIKSNEKFLKKST